MADPDREALLEARRNVEISIQKLHNEMEPAQNAFSEIEAIVFQLENFARQLETEVSPFTARSVRAIAARSAQLTRRIDVVSKQLAPPLFVRIKELKAAMQQAAEEKTRLEAALQQPQVTV